MVGGGTMENHLKVEHETLEQTHPLQLVAWLHMMTAELRLLWESKGGLNQDSEADTVEYIRAEQWPQDRAVRERCNFLSDVVVIVPQDHLYCHRGIPSNNCTQSTSLTPMKVTQTMSSYQDVIRSNGWHEQNIPCLPSSKLTEVNNTTRETRDLHMLSRSKGNKASEQCGNRCIAATDLQHRGIEGTHTENGRMHDSDAIEIIPYGLEHRTPLSFMGTSEEELYYDTHSSDVIVINPIASFIVQGELEKMDSNSRTCQGREQAMSSTISAVVNGISENHQDDRRANLNTFIADKDSACGMIVERGFKPPSPSVIIPTASCMVQGEKEKQSNMETKIRQEHVQVIGSTTTEVTQLVLLAGRGGEGICFLGCAMCSWIIKIDQQYNFSWLVMHDKVLTTDNMDKMNCPSHPLCSLYLCIEETTPHPLTQ
jgi:hypothetical protein